MQVRNNRRGPRRVLGVPLSVMLFAAVASAGLVSFAGPAGAATLGPVDPTIADGDTDSLRDVIENQASSGDVVVLVAGATYVLDDCQQGSIEIGIDLTIQGNGATIMQDATCFENVITLRSSTLTLQGLTIRGGRAGDGGGIEIQGNDAHLIVVESTFTDNLACDEGGAIVQDADDASSVTILRSTFTGNTAGEGSAVDADEGGTLLIVNSTISGNTASEGAAISVDNGAAATVVYSTIARNTVADFVCPDSQSEADEAADDEVRPAQNPPAANVGVEEDESSLEIFGTVIAEPINGPNCGDETDDWLPLDATDSHGYNFSDDATCGLTNATDKQTAGSPNLGALASNGGPTRTLLPGAGSPLLDKIPLASCDATAVLGEAVTTDQRGVTRPQGTGCDIGAVEVVVTPAPTPPPVVTPTFTG